MVLGTQQGRKTKSLSGLLKAFLVEKHTRRGLDGYISQYASPERTLDLGCGNSAYARLFPNRVALENKKRDDVHVIGDAHCLPFRSESFDIVLCTEVLEHVVDPTRVIGEIKRVLRTSGKLLMSTRFVFPIHDAPSDFYRFTKYGLSYLLRDFEIRELKAELDTLATYAALAQRIAFQMDLRGGKVARAFILTLARIINSLGRVIIKKEYGDAGRTRPEEQIMASGYFVVAAKPERDEEPK